MSIEIRNLSKRFGNFTALNDVSLDIDHGVRNASHVEASRWLGFFGSRLRSTAPLFSSRKSVFFQLLPPSVDLKTPRSGWSL